MYTKYFIISMTSITKNLLTFLWERIKETKEKQETICIIERMKKYYTYN